jgi:hypothetical protein
MFTDHHIRLACTFQPEATENARHDQLYVSLACMPSCLSRQRRESENYGTSYAPDPIHSYDLCSYALKSIFWMCEPEPISSHRAACILRVGCYAIHFFIGHEHKREIFNFDKLFLTGFEFKTCIMLTLISCAQKIKLIEKDEQFNYSQLPRTVFLTNQSDATSAPPYLYPGSCPASTGLPSPGSRAHAARPFLRKHW